VEKSKELTFPPRLEILQSAQDFHFSNPAATTIIIFSGFARRINAWVNGHNRRCLSLRGNENPLEFDPLYRTATCGLHYGQELGSTNRPDTFEQTKPSPMKILLAIRRRTIHFPRHGYGYLYGSIHGICCTWNLNVPTLVTGGLGAGLIRLWVGGICYCFG
jgi:hypothetical protein